MARVLNATPHFSKTIGRERTPPPTMVATRLNVPTKRLDGRWAESNGGTR